MCWPRPSATSDMPIRSRNDSARILIVGCVSTERADRLGGDEHDEHREHDGRDHDAQVVGHADGRDDRVEREHDVEDHDLSDHGGERRGTPRGPVFAALELVVNLLGRLGEQEQTAADEDQVTAGDRLPHQP